MPYKSFTNLFNLFGLDQIDRAVFYAVSSKAWQLVAGPVTLLIIAHYFTSELQGFFFTFASLLALQTFVELGFYLVIINVASHEWSRLDLDEEGRLTGDEEALSRLISLGRLVFKWYAIASVAFVAGVSVIGYVFFSQSDYPSVQWQMPWLSIVFLTGLSLWTLPYVSLLEGCNQIVSVNLFRLIQAILGTLSLCLTIALGLGLWAAVVTAGTRFLCAVYLILVQYKNFFYSFLSPPTGATMLWRDEIWPMQWRLGISGLVTYFSFSIFNPVMFHYHGAVVAGKMGVTLKLLSALQSIGIAWVFTKVPRFGILIAKNDHRTLNRFWLRSSLVSLIFFIAGAMLLWALIYALNLFQLPLAQRMLGPFPTALFLLACIFMQAIQCQVAYLRAHKKEPTMVVSVTSSLMIGLLVWFLGGRFGPVATAWVYLAVMALASLWTTAIWFRCRAKWHNL
jgi:O-antigen/teichoic acid export membrane protein